MLKRMLSNTLAVVDASMLGRIPRNMWTLVDLCLQQWFPPALGDMRLDYSSFTYHERVRLSSAFVYA